MTPKETFDENKTREIAAQLQESGYSARALTHWADPCVRISFSGKTKRERSLIWSRHIKDNKNCSYGTHCPPYLLWDDDVPDDRFISHHERHHALQFSELADFTDADFNNILAVLSVLDEPFRDEEPLPAPEIDPYERVQVNYYINRAQMQSVHRILNNDPRFSGVDIGDILVAATSSPETLLTLLKGVG